MTIYEFDRYINGRLMAEGVTIEKAKTLDAATAAAARIASKGPKGEAPVLVLRREPAATQPDHLALVAAAYRDAMDWLLDMRAVDDDGNETTPEADVYVTLINSLPKRTPADAEAHLTALLWAEYERGKAEAAALWSRNSRETFEAMCAMRDAINEHVPMPSLESDLLKGPEASVFCAAVAEAVIGALLTQEGR